MKKRRGLGRYVMRNNLKEILAKEGINLRDLADKSDLMPSTINKIADGRANPTLRTANKILIVLNAMLANGKQYKLNELFPAIETEGTGPKINIRRNGSKN
jgi:transcriptional regulator with XRE-family HTH domain